MVIKDFEMEYWDRLVDFNRRMYPSRKNVAALQKFRMLDCPSSEDMHLNAIMLDDEGEIRAQILYTSTGYYLRGEKNECLWGYDLVVEPEFRKMNYGLDMLEYMRDYRKLPFFAAGINETALKLEKIILKSRIIGYLKKYVKVVNPLFVPLAIDRHIGVDRFPDRVGCFRKATDCEKLPDRQTAYNMDLIEFVRDKAFLSWRFFKAPHSYAVYVSEEGTDYFVVRTIVRQHITALVLVDYRCSMQRTDALSGIIDAAIGLTKKLRLPILISASSLADADREFESKGFKTVGNHRPITMNRNVDSEKEKIDTRSFVFLTLADSDGEINW